MGWRAELPLTHHPAFHPRRAQALHPPAVDPQSEGPRRAAERTMRELPPAGGHPS